MNKIFTYISLLLLTAVLSCDTSSTVKPRNENFFFKVYGGISEADHLAKSVIETADGGLLILGTMVDDNENPLEIVVIKTGSAGELLWQRGYADVINNNYRSEAVEILETISGYVIAGIYDSTSIRHSILFEINQTGEPTGNRAVINSSTALEADYLVNALTLGPTGLLASGTTDQVTDDGKGGSNGFLRKINLDLSEVTVNGRWIFGLEGNENVSGAYEVSDPSLMGSRDITYLVFGTTTGSTITGNSNYFLYGLTNDFREAIEVAQIDDASGTKSATKVIEDNGRYWMVGSVNNNEIYRAGWQFNEAYDIDWEEIGTGAVNLSNGGELGKSLAIAGSNSETLIIGDKLGPTLDIVVGKVDVNRNLLSGWPLTFGNTASGNTSSNYRATDIIVLSDGSIIILGTADLENTKKIVVIKTGPNGEMSFD